MDQSLEQWRPVAGYEGLYEVSSFGRVRSLPRTTRKCDDRLYSVKGRILKQVGKAPYGHMRVFLSKNGKLATHYVHCIVAEAFLGPRPAGLYVCHGLNGVTDNAVNNLSYQTPAANQKDRFRDGTNVVGSKCSWSKLKEQNILEIRRAAGLGVPQNELAEQYNVSKATICNIVKRKVWKHI